MQYSNKKKYRKSVFFFDKMEMKQIITATFAVILICLVAVPLIDTSSEQVRSVEQNTSQRYYATSSDGLTEDLTIKLESENRYTINGEPFTLNSITIIADTAMWVLYGNNYNLYQTATSTTQKSLNIGGSTTFYTDGTYKATSSTGTEYTGTFSKLIYPSIDGNLGYFMSSTAYADNDAEIIFFSITNSNGAMFAEKYKASGEFVESIISPFSASGSVTLSSPSVVYSTNESDDTVADRKIKALTYTVGETEYTCYAFIAPIDYTTISDNDSIVISLLDMIPVLLIAALLIGIGYSIMRRE